jgi:four helix bundle suffix protein
VREVGKEHRTGQSDQADRSGAAAYAAWLTDANPAVIANTVICLIHQANYLLDQQIAALERQFIQEGGYSERLAAARLEQRRGQERTDPTDRADKEALPACPLCGKAMVVRTARKGERAGSQFLGSSGYPECKGTRTLDGSDRSRK